MGTLTVVDADHPRTYAIFAPTAEFDSVRDLFKRQNERDDDAIAEIDALDLRLRSSAGSEVQICTIQIEGSRAMWRFGYFRSLRAQNDHSFWQALGAEVGPDRCRSANCSRLVIQCSAFCKQHHFRTVMGVDYDGTDPV
jgi:hypothetical protein